MTLSVGCRAPSVSDLVSSLAENMASRSINDDVVRRYTDEELLTGDINSFSNGQLTDNAKQKARGLVLDSLSNMLGDDDWWDEFFGKYVTEQKRNRIGYPMPLCEDNLPGTEGAIVDSVLTGDEILFHAEGISFAYSCVPAKDPNYTLYRLFANGKMWQYKTRGDDATVDSMVCLYKVIANHRQIDNKLLLNCSGGDKEAFQNSGAIEFLEELVNIGVLYCVGSRLFETFDCD